MEISEEAVRRLKEFRDRTAYGSPVRIGILSGNTSGSVLGVMVDDKSEKDKDYAFGDLKVIIDSDLMAYCGSITVEYVPPHDGACGGGGFKIVAKRPL
ncbi:MAG: hypothetical protein V2I36_16350 [Desulfopila sp.]|nr:hypothetical protein [Desulfopila sp.]